MNLLLAGFIFNAASSPIPTLLNSIKKPSIATATLVIQSLVNLAIMALFSKMQGYGIALAFLLSNIIYYLILIGYVIKKGYGYNFNYLLRISFTLIPASFAFLFKGLLIKTAIFLVLFFVGSVIFKSVKKSDISIIKQIIFSKSSTL